MFKVVQKPTVKRWQARVRGIRQVAESERKRLAREHATEFRNFLMENILTQKYAGNYAPYNPKYAKYKDKKVGHLKFWVFSGLLVSSITIWPTKEGFSVGINRNAKYPGGKSVAWIASLHEHGLGGMPRRSIFEPSLAEYKGIFWAKAPPEVFRKMRRVWRR